MSDRFLETAELWWRWAGLASVQVFLVVGLVFLVDRCAGRRWSPRLSAALWAMVMLKFVAPPVLTSPVSLARLELPSTLLQQPAQAVNSAGVLPWAFGIWILGVNVCWVWMTLRSLQLGRARMRRSEPMGVYDLGVWIRPACTRLGLLRSPVVRVDHSGGGPAVIGFFRPTVFLPAELLRDGNSSRIEHVVLHELAHVKRRDPLVGLICTGVQVLYWFHPVAWYARRRLSVLREVCCDRSVVRSLGGHSHGYRDTLLEFARPLAAGMGGLGFVHRHSQLMSRLAWLERPLGRRSPLRSAAAVCLMLVLSAAIVPHSGGAGSAPLDRASAAVRPPGCMQYRFSVLAALAREKEQYFATSAQSDGNEPG